MNKASNTRTSFAEDIDAGLSAPAKFIASKYFYDAVGDALFTRIMQLPEYYLTRAEQEIFETHASYIIHDAGLETDFQVIELGAGDGTKTRVLLQAMLQQKRSFSYFPIDISPHVLQELGHNMQSEIEQGLKLKGIAGDYFDALKSPDLPLGRQKLILFLGSTIGNFPEDDGSAFLQTLSGHISRNDALLVGFDLKKDPALIAAAYNDAAGVTRDFNLNLLTRINRELDADFDLEQFVHAPAYEPGSGEARSYLVSKCSQQVTLKALNKRFAFNEGEKIHTEVSRKYNDGQIGQLAAAAGLRILQAYYDKHQYFTNVLFRKN